ncbi:MAG: glycosyltransferase [Methanocorpusculum sp.]|nr:glycosyltransferase [Methanocorpusculum sp.]
MGGRNLGILASRGEWIGFVDSDDVAASTMFEKMYQVATTTDCDIVNIQAASFENGGKRDQLDHPYVLWSPELLNLHNKPLTDADRNVLIVESPGAFWTKLFRRSFFLSHNVYFPLKIRWEDNALGSLLMNYVSKTAFLPEILYYYRQNPSSITHTVNYTSIKERIASEEYLLGEVLQRDLFDLCRPALSYVFTLRYFLTTSWLVSSATDVPNKTEVLCLLRRRLLDVFPDYNLNVFYRARTSFITRLQVVCFLHFPSITSMGIRGVRLFLQLPIVQSHKIYLLRCKTAVLRLISCFC